jgi:Fe-S cluster assembly iron-binding protein IscA
MAKDANPNLALRIQVESGGCHGFQYLLSLSSIPALSASSSSSTPEIPIEDAPALNTSSSDSNAPSSPPAPATLTDTLATAPTTADAQGKADDAKELDEEDVVFEDEESHAKVVIDVSSLELLKGSKVEYTMGLIGSQFTVINPNSSSNCGCGTSFDIKI